MYSLERLFFSIRGSYLALDSCETGLKLHTVHDFRGWAKEMAKIPLPAQGKVGFRPGEMEIDAGTWRCSVAMFGKDNLWFRGKGAGMSLYFGSRNEAFLAALVLEQDGRFLLVSDYTNSYIWITPLKGRLCARVSRTEGETRPDSVSVELVPNKEGVFEVAMEQFPSPSVCSVVEEWSYERCVKEAAEDYEAFEEKFCCSNDFEREAVYSIWSNILEPNGNFETETVLMSKAGMSAVWSWDNCFNALALCKAHPQLAYDQIMLPYRLADEYGCTPDAISDYSLIQTYVKPPVQGWIYREMIARNPVFAQHHYLEPLYREMKRNTQWWINMRGPVPYYVHGNDSGADNATCFDKSNSAETPELLALLAVQSSFLSEAATKLGYVQEKEYFARLSGQLAEMANQNYWDGESLFVRPLPEREPYASGALLPWRMIVMGKQTDREILTATFATLEKDFLGRYGLASERLGSPKFAVDGYWRGAAWPPDQVLFVLSLQRLGQEKLAQTIAARYKKGLEQSGFSENMNVHQGTSLCCKSYTWAAAAYLIL